MFLKEIEGKRVIFSHFTERKKKSYTKCLYYLFLTLGLPRNSRWLLFGFMYTDTIPKLCIYEMKHRDHIWEPERKQNNLSMNIIYLPKKYVACETAV